MEITFSQGKKGNQVVFAPHGDLDLYASVLFCDKVLSQFTRTTNHLVLNFSGVRYLDSSGVGALIRLAQHSKSIAGEIQIASLSGTPKKVLEMSNIIRLFKVVPDVETALQAWE
jgi:anti-anti-sigma factor